MLDGRCAEIAGLFSILTPKAPSLQPRTTKDNVAKQTSSARWRSTSMTLGGVLVLFLIEVVLLMLTQGPATKPLEIAVIQTKGSRLTLAIEIVLDMASPPIAFNLVAICMLAVATAMVTDAPHAASQTKGKAGKAATGHLASAPAPRSLPQLPASTSSSAASRAPTVARMCAFAAMGGIPPWLNDM